MASKSRRMKVECGSVGWGGLAKSTDEAITKALVDVPEAPGVLLRVHDGFIWHYIEFWAAMKIAGYNKRDFEHYAGRPNGTS